MWLLMLSYFWGCVGLCLLGVFREDWAQGEYYKIMYVHIPYAWFMIWLYVVITILSVLNEVKMFVFRKTINLIVYLDLLCCTVCISYRCFVSLPHVRDLLSVWYKTNFSFNNVFYFIGLCGYIDGCRKIFEFLYYSWFFEFAHNKVWNRLMVFIASI